MSRGAYPLASLAIYMQIHTLSYFSIMKYLKVFRRVKMQQDNWNSREEANLWIPLEREWWTERHPAWCGESTQFMSQCVNHVSTQVANYCVAKRGLGWAMGGREIGYACCLAVSATTAWITNTVDVSFDEGHAQAAGPNSSHRIQHEEPSAMYTSRFCFFC